MSTVLKSGSLNLLEPSGPVQACNWDCFTYYLLALPITFTYYLYLLALPITFTYYLYLLPLPFSFTYYLYLTFTMQRIYYPSSELLLRQKIEK